MLPIVILGRPSPTTDLLVHELEKSFNVAAVIFEHQPVQAKLRLLERRCKRVGLWTVIQQLLFLVWDRLYIARASNRRIQELTGHHMTDIRSRTRHVHDVNSPEVVTFLQEIKPACGVISGTSILRSPLIESVPIWLNIHCGITPRYRGVHGAFWAVVEGQPELAGVTIHQIDAGVDTGDIIAQEKIEVDSRDTYRTLPVKQYFKGIPLLVTAVKHVLDGTLTTYKRTDLESKLWYSPTISDYFRFQRRLKALSRE